MKTETGVMVMKNGNAWGCVYEDGHSTEYGWMDPEDAPIHNPECCTKPTDVTYRDSHYIRELSTAKLVRVERTTTLVFFAGMKLTNPTDIALNTAFAIEVVGWKTEVSGDALLFYNENGAFMGGRNDGQPWSGIPEFTRSADLVLPYLYKREEYCELQKGARGMWMCVIGSASQRSFCCSDPYSPARAMVIALLRAHNVEVEFA